MLDAVEEPEEDESLLFDLACMTVWHYFKQILPLPVRLLLRAISLGPRILKGLEEAVTGNVFKSEVLDAAAISMALITGDTKTASNINFLLSLAVFLATGNMTKVMATLMVDYSCAMKLASPIAVLSAMKEAAENRIIVAHGIATKLNGKKLVIGSRHFVFDDEKVFSPAMMKALPEMPQKLQGLIITFPVPCPKINSNI